MTRKEVQKVIEGNPGKQLYITFGSSRRLSLHEPVSKTTALKHSKHFHTVRCWTFGEERSDLAGYLSRPHGRESLGWNSQIVTFDMREKINGKT